MFSTLAQKVSRYIINYIRSPLAGYHSFTTLPAKQLSAVMEAGDILLVEGNTRLANAIKYLTHSNWSHAALYIGKQHEITDEAGQICELIEADLGKGVIALPLSFYSGFNTRICRPANLSASDKKQVVDYAISRLGHQYDLKNVFDLMRYMLPNPPVPHRFRRRMIALGSGDPTRAICSTLIAEAFQSIHYPILPEITNANAKEIYHIRHHSLFTPRDFDLSPYFQIVKPGLDETFDHHLIEWGAQQITAPPINND